MQLHKNKKILIILISILIFIVSLAVLGYIKIWYFEHIFNVVEHIFNLLYLISGTLLVFGLYFGYLQVELLKSQTKEQIIQAREQIDSITEDMRTRNQRAAVEKSMEYLDLFATSLLPKINNFYGKIEKEEFEKIPDWVPKDHDYKIDVLNLDSDLQLKVLPILNERYKYGISDILNKIEFFSAGVIHGLADEDVLYAPISDTFREIIEREMICICHFRHNNAPFENTIKLYEKWYARANIKSNILNLEETQRKMEILKAEVAAAEELARPNSPIGL